MTGRSDRLALGDLVAELEYGKPSRDPLRRVRKCRFLGGTRPVRQRDLEAGA